MRARVRHRAREIPADPAMARFWPTMLFRRLHRLVAAQRRLAPARAEKARASAVPATPVQFSLLRKAHVETATMAES
jgi:hypothetical protein